MCHPKNNARSGQLLLLSVTMLGGLIISATAVAGLLLRYQLRLTNDAAKSAKALFAADGRLEWHNYCAEKNKSVIGSARGNPGAINQLNNNGIDCAGAGLPPGFLDPQVSADSSIFFYENATQGTVDARIFSEGLADKATRAVETVLPF